MKKSEIYTSDEGTCFSWRDECLATQKELAKLRDLLRWRKVGDEMPTSHDLQLCFHAGQMIPFLAYAHNGDWFYDNDDRYPTHWRPIGPLPTEEHTAIARAKGTK